MRRSYIYYFDRWLAGVKMSLDIDYGNPVSVRKSNHGSNVFRKAAADIGKYYPEKIESFADLLYDDDAEIRVHAAISIAQYMPHTKRQLALIKKVIIERMSICDEASHMGWEWWMNQPWASEDNCIEESNNS